MARRHSVTLLCVRPLQPAAAWFLLSKAVFCAMLKASKRLQVSLKPVATLWQGM